MSYFQIYINDKGEVIRSDIYNTSIKLLCSNFDIFPRKQKYPILFISVYPFSSKIFYEIKYEIDDELNYQSIYGEKSYSIKNKVELVNWILTQTYRMKLRKLNQ